MEEDTGEITTAEGVQHEEVLDPEIERYAESIRSRIDSLVKRIEENISWRR